MKRNNPFLLPQEDPWDLFKQQKENEDKVKAERREINRLLFEMLIVDPRGQDLCRFLHKNVLIPSHFDKKDPNAAQLALWWDGYKSAYRDLIQGGVTHQETIAHGG